MRAVMANALGVSVGERISSSMHAQHGVTVVAALDADVRVRHADGEEVCGRVVVVPADVEHSLESAGPMIGMLYDVEAFAPLDGYARERRRGRVVEDRLARVILGAARAHRASLERPEVLEGIGREAALAATGAPRRVDRRVARVLELLRDPDADREALLGAAGVGDAHLQALFARDVGIPIRTYRLWSRLMAACARLRVVDATAAAHGAGFSDLAHLSRTCRRMLGHSPSEMRDAFLAIAR